MLERKDKRLVRALAHKLNWCSGWVDHIDGHSTLASAYRAMYEEDRANLVELLIHTGHLNPGVQEDGFNAWGGALWYYPPSLVVWAAREWFTDLPLMDKVSTGDLVRLDPFKVVYMVARYSSGAKYVYPISGNADWRTRLTSDHTGQILDIDIHVLAGSAGVL